jgi:D-alanine-D-alanine ligase
VRIGVVHTFASSCHCHVTLERSLERLGHQCLRFDSESVPERVGELAALDLVFDQTDQFRGEGLFRPVVRALLDARGARTVGTAAQGCFLTDDKLATRAVLERASVPMPRGGPLPAAPGLPFPRVLKPVHEQRSRGLAVVRDAGAEAAALAAAREQGFGAFLVEEFIPGRELAVTVLGDRVLPITEWTLAGKDVLDYEAKTTGRCPFPAVIEREVAERIGELALRAFRALGLQDWARFDVRLNARGEPFFLEANTKPSLEENSPCLVAAQAEGIEEADFIKAIIAVAGRRLERR